MKFYISFFFVVLVAFTGCSKSSNSTSNILLSDSGCIGRFRMPVNAHSIPPADVAVVDNMFASNNINHNSFRYYRYIHDSLHTQYPPYAVYDQKSVRLDQYANGVRILNGDLVFLFLDDHFSNMGGHLTNGTSLDTVPFLETGQLRRLFLRDIERFEHASNLYRDSCFKAEFGYYNINTGISSAPEVLVKAWKVTPANTVFPSEFPAGFYQDSTGKLLSYQNRWVSFR